MVGDLTDVNRYWQERQLWNERVERMPEEEMIALQWIRLKKQLQYDYDNSIFYRKKFEAIGVTPHDIKSMEDFQEVPLTTKDEHRRAQEESLEVLGHPYGMITCAPIEKVVRISSTSGTTGTPTLYTLTKHDVDVVNEMHARKYWRAGLRPGNIVLQALSLSMFTGGLPLSDGIQAMGLCCVPVGIEGGTKRIIDFLQLTRPQAIIATPSFGEYLIEKSISLTGKEAKDLGIRWFFCAAEPGGGIPAVRDRLREGFQARVFDHTGGGHAFHGICCGDREFRGMHFISPDHCILELVDPVTKKVLPLTDGAVGEMVFTFIGWEGGPFLRYLLGDILQIFTTPCECGFPGMRFQILGRGDDMLIVKGVNIYPTALKDAVARFHPRTTGVLKVLLGQPGPLVKPPLKMMVEYGASIKKEELPDLKEEIRKYIKVNLRVNPEIEWAAPNSIHLKKGSTGKVKLVEVREGYSK
jgi:phenylacetate-CoA ligase